MERCDGVEVQPHIRADTGPTAGVDSIGLVSSIFASRSAATAASHTSPQESEVPPAAAVRRARSAPLQALASAAVTAAWGPVAAPQSAAVGTGVGGTLWQQAFAAHAETLLRETQQQVDELRRYQQKAAREAQRADAVAAANRALEVQLAEADAKRAEDRAAHESAVNALSQQVLRLEEAVGVLRRTKLELQRQIKGAQTAAAQQEAVHRRELREVRSAFESELKRMRAEQHLQADEWRHERHRLEEKLVEWDVTEVAVSTQQMQLLTRRAELERKHEAVAAASLGAAPTPAYEAEAERAAAVPRVDAATNTDVVALPAAQAIPQESDASPYTRVHRDVLAQQQLREQTMLSELSIADARIQQESKQRRLAEERVAELLEQSEQLREALTNAEAAAANTERVSEVARQETAVAVTAKAAGGRDNAGHQMGRRDAVAHGTEHDLRTQQRLLQEIQYEYTALRRESSALFERHREQQRCETERWAAVRSAVGAVLHVAGLHDVRSTLEHAAAAAAADTSNLSCLGEVLADSSEASLNATLAALDTLASTLRSQQQAAAADEAALQQQRRLSTLEEALRVAEAQNEARIASLSATEAQLHESQRELSAWQRRHNDLAARQDVYDAAWRAAEVQLKQIIGILRRALREYAQPLSASLARLSSPGDDADSAGRRVTRRRSARAVKRRSQSSPASAASLDGIEDSEGHAAMLPTTADAAPVWASDGDAIADADLDDLLQDAFVLPKVAGEGDKMDRPEAVADGEGESLSRRRTTRTANLPQSSAATLVVVESTDGGSDASHSEVRRDMAVVVWGLLKLLTAWRDRQHALVEARKALQRQLADMTAKNTALVEERREAATRCQRQLRLSRAAEQRRAHQLEQAHKELEDVKRKHMLDSAQAHQKAAEWEGEREALRRRLRVAEEQLNRAEQALVEADVDHNAQHASQEMLQHALSDVTAARDRLERRQADLCVHIEDLETRLSVTERTQTDLHALITTSVAFIVRLLADHEQLQEHYRVLRTLAWTDAQAARMVERVLENCCPERSEQATALAGERGLPWSTGAASGVSASPAGAAPHSATSSTLLRIAGHAVRAVLRLSRLLTARQRLRSHAGTRRSDGSILSPSAAAAEPASLQPLLLALSSAFAWGAATPALNNAAASLHDSRLRRYATRPDSCVLPVVHLPAPLELAAVAHNEAAEVEAGGHAGLSKVRFDLRSRACEDEETYIGADHHQQRQLVQLLTVAQIDMQAPTTRHLCDGVLAASSASARATVELLQLAQVREALSATLLRRRGRNRLSIAKPQPVLPVPDLRPLLPDRLAALLQSHLQRAVTQTCQVAESHMLVQRLMHHNETLVSALKLRTNEHAAASAEVRSLTSQLQLQQAERAERTAVQERLVEVRASLLRERELRRAAEARLAELQQARLQWLSDREQYKREVYSLNMELAGTSVGGASPAGGGTRPLPPFAHGGGAGPALATSALSIQVDNTTMSDAARRPAAPSSHLDALADSVMDGSALCEQDFAHGSHPQVWRAAAFAAEVDYQRNSENVYYHELLRNGHERDSHARAGHRHGGNIGAHADAPKWSSAHGETPPLRTPHCRPRTNLPTPQDLAESGSPDDTRSAGAAPGAGGGGGGVRPTSDTDASLWNEQRQPHGPSCAIGLSPTAASMDTLKTTTPAERPPAPQPLLTSANALELYVPSVARQREKPRSHNAVNCEERRLDTTAKTTRAKRKTINNEGFGIVSHAAATASPSSSFLADAPAPESDVCAATPPPLSPPPPLRSTADTETPAEERRGSTHQQLRRSAANVVEPPSAVAANHGSTASTAASFSAPRPPPPHSPSKGVSASASADMRTEAPTLSREEFDSTGQPTAAAGVTRHVSGPLYFRARPAR
ncbi:conserved hypothetical protein [Leishmania infantum JPCM5]|uniref:Uncharacterized protein n=2 Tax=Leishmania infantum TaxID=5671 RepID=A4HTI9_LEIIN|nr:conserved hypothetical protein [Leishmania infantum JPCM5]CAC9450976.1 hypothetical_protein_-_conserved [Leishmania infantum]CAM65739.1 conserved hypothetical protein [Leishmania infantum JPCM5]SUZ39356.1 hypothetical_protein_-_conserved [Leishmania infantum]|eukprot:XP_001463380.1 conserved hypothetical protein [Leishmania infantum JPCM5]